MRGTSGAALLACSLGLLVAASPGAYADYFGDFSFAGPVGERLNHHDLKAIAKATQPLLDDDSLPIGTTREWSNPASGDHGTIQLLKRFEYKYEGSNLPCRELRYHVQVTTNGDPYNYELNRCKVADGTWKIL